MWNIAYKIINIDEPSSSVRNRCHRLRGSICSVQFGDLPLGQDFSKFCPLIASALSCEGRIRPFCVASCGSSWRDEVGGLHRRNWGESQLSLVVARPTS